VIAFAIKREILMSLQSSFKILGAIAIFGLASGTPIASVAEDVQVRYDLEVLHDFSNGGVQGTFPQTGLTQLGLDLFGITSAGGNFGKGVVYRIDRFGLYEVLHHFGPAERGIGTLSAGADGNLYGATDGGQENAGAIYRVTAKGKYSIFHSFSMTGDVQFPTTPPIRGTDGAIYGYAYSPNASCGVIYRLKGGVASSIHRFNSDQPEGCDITKPLLQGSDKRLYGRTTSGGTWNQGAFFSLSTAGNFKVLHYPTLQEGDGGSSLLAEGPYGNLYGTSYRGGEFGYGSIFRMSKKGHFKQLHSFDYFVDGTSPEGLIWNGIDVFYGWTRVGGVGFAGGSLFQMTSTGNVKVVYSFKADSFNPIDAPCLIGGQIFGATLSGGDSFVQGTVFRLTQK
jgi:uncharacterized repeat protein (TIGR03803 family)